MSIKYTQIYTSEYADYKYSKVLRQQFFINTNLIKDKNLKKSFDLTTVFNFFKKD